MTTPVSGVIAPRRYIVISRNLLQAEQIFSALMQTGENIAGYGVALPEQAHQLEQNVQPEVIVVERGLSISTQLPILYFDSRVDVAELAKQIVLPPATPAPQPKPMPSPSLSWRTALGFVGMAGGVGTTTLVCAFALAAARRGESVLVVDMAGGDCLPTFGGELRRETAAWGVRKKDYGERLGVIVSGSLSRIERQPDVLLVDAGTLRETARADTLIRSGIKLFYVVPHDLDAQGLTHPSRERRLVNKTSKVGAGRIPYDQELTRRINAGQFEPEDTGFMRACAAWLETQLLH